MSEMLGNQYFLARNYSGAAHELEKVLREDLKNKAIRRKLIVCYIQIGDIQKALSLFLALVKEDIDFIINTNPIDDDCPCPELVYKSEKFLPDNRNSLDFHLMLGMLWLYCDISKSIEYFEKAHVLQPQNPNIKSVLALLNSSAKAGISLDFVE